MDYDKGIPEDLICNLLGAVSEGHGATFFSSSLLDRLNPGNPTDPLHYIGFDAGYTGPYKGEIGFYRGYIGIRVWGLRFGLMYHYC